MNFLVRATPTGGLLELSADDRDELLAGERRVATALIAEGVIVWMWRLPGNQASVSVWNADSADALDGHVRALPFFPYNDIEITALAAHPAFPAVLERIGAVGPVGVDG